MKRFCCLLLAMILVVFLMSCKDEDKELLPKEVKSIEDIYSLDDDKMNFSTLYVVKNEAGIVTFVNDMYEHWEEYEGEPSWSVVRLHINDIDATQSASYELIGFTGSVSPTKLMVGDEVICHHNYALQSQIYPSDLYVYNLFYTGGSKQITSYQDFPTEDGIPQITVTP